MSTIIHAPEFEALLQALSENPDTVIPDTFRNLIIKIEGKDQSGCIDARTAQAIVRLQQIVNRLAAQAIYGKTATASNLTEAQLAQFRLQFSAKPGCTEISAGIWAAFTSLLKEIFKNMPPQFKIIGLFLLASSFLGYVSVDKAFQYFEHKLDREMQLKLSQEETERLKAVIGQSQNAGQEAATDFAKSAKGATGLTFGARQYDGAELKDIQKRVRTRPGMDTIEGDFTVVGVKKSRQNHYTVMLKSDETGEEIKATVPQNDLFEDDTDIPKTPEAIVKYMSRGLIHVTMLVKTTKTKTERLVTDWAPIDED